jgi:bile acid:Na+ symporter, BASS family
MTTQSSQSVLINGFGVLFVILNAFGLGLRLSVGKLLAQAFAHWKIAVWALVINFVIIPLLFIGYLLTIASSIPGEIKVGFCVAALSAGMPFAPLLARLAKADVSISTTLLLRSSEVDRLLVSDLTRSGRARERRPETGSPDS